jgi:hypothetical protein
VKHTSRIRPACSNSRHRICGVNELVKCVTLELLRVDDGRAIIRDIPIFTVARPRGGGFEPPPPLASRITPGIRTKPQRNFFGKGVGVPHCLASAYLKS